VTTTYTPKNLMKGKQAQDCLKNLQLNLTYQQQKKPKNVVKRNDAAQKFNIKRIETALRIFIQAKPETALRHVRHCTMSPYKPASGRLAASLLCQSSFQGVASLDRQPIR